jgi:hypothetical protein
MKSRSASEWVKEYDSVYQELTVKGFKPKLQTLDNEAYTALKNFFTVNDIAYQLVPPHCHRRNAAERAIRTFKEHFVAGISSVDPSFPMHLWNRLLPQAEITLNLLIPQVRPAQKYPNSPWEMIHPPGEIMQYVCDLTRSTWLGVPSHSQPLINAKYQIQVTNYL